MNRRSVIAAGMVAAAFAGAGRKADAQISAAARSTAGLPPRKVIAATSMQQFWVQHPGLEKRLEELTAIIDRMRAESQQKYGRNPDLAILPEVAVTGEAGADVASCAVPLEGAFSNAFSGKAREYACYVIAPTYLKESDGSYTNAAVLFGRKGELVGIYRKVHLVVSPDGKRMEGGSTPGRDVPVFECDFGKLGIQICYDIEFDRGWQELASKGADLIAWPTQSPQTSLPVARAIQNRCYIVSSTWRNNASVFEPTGKIVSQLKPPGQVLAQEIDLSYAILPWSSKVRHGKALAERYGSAVGFRYYEDEDCGIFWSNEPGKAVKQMVQALGLLEEHEQLANVRRFYSKAGVLDY